MTVTLGIMTVLSIIMARLSEDGILTATQIRYTELSLVSACILFNIVYGMQIFRTESFGENTMHATFKPNKFFRPKVGEFFEKTFDQDRANCNTFSETKVMQEKDAYRSMGIAK